MIGEQSHHFLKFCDHRTSIIHLMHRQQNMLLHCFLVFFLLTKYLLPTHCVPNIMLCARDQEVNNIPSEGQMHSEFERLTKLCGILQKWKDKRGNWPTNGKLYQRIESDSAINSNQT